MCGKCVKTENVEEEVASETSGHEGLAAKSTDRSDRGSLADSLGVSGATIFLGFGGVASAVYEQKLFPKGVVDPRGQVRPETNQHIAIQARP